MGGYEIKVWRKLTDSICNIPILLARGGVVVDKSRTAAIDVECPVCDNRYQSQSSL